MRAFASFTSCLLVSLTLASSAFAQSAPKADNTAQNKGALLSDAVTAEKQSNRKGQVKSLAAIRRRVMREKGLSMDAKNVKILYADGAVTLSGPVDSDEERAKVEAVVKSYNGTKSVDNQLTVAPKKH